MEDLQTNGMKFETQVETKDINKNNYACYCFFFFILTTSGKIRIQIFLNRRNKKYHLITKLLFICQSISMNYYQNKCRHFLLFLVTLSFQNN